MARPQVSIEDLLLRHRAIDDDQLRKAREEQRRVGGELGRVLVDLGYVSEELLLRAQSHQLGIPMVSPDQAPRELAQALGEALCKRFGVIPVSGNVESKLLRVATSSPANTVRLQQLAEASGFRIEAAAATSESIEKAIRAAFSGISKPPEPLAPKEEPADRAARIEKMQASILARVERLEQIAEKDHHALNIVAQVLLDLGFITRDELKKRLGQA